jgi:hypothetical protein
MKHNVYIFWINLNKPGTWYEDNVILPTTIPDTLEEINLNEIYIIDNS